MKPTSDSIEQGSAGKAEHVYQAAAELLGALSTPVRLRALDALRDGELTVTQLVERIGCSHSNLSQHLCLLYRMGIVSRRKEGAAVIYKAQSDQAMAICSSVCAQVALEMADGAQVASSDAQSELLSLIFW